MKIEKFFLCVDTAIYRASQRTGIPQLNYTQLRFLYGLRRLGTTSQTALADFVFLHRPHVKRADNRSSWNYLNSLCLLGLAIRETHKRYSITPLGREYLSYIRSYLLNKRL